MKDYNYKNYAKFLVFSFSLFLILSCNHSKNKAGNLSGKKDTASSSQIDSTGIKVNIYTGRIAANARDADAYWNRGKLEAKKNNLSLALTDLAKAISIDSTKSDYYYNFADVEFVTGHTHEARDAFETSIRLNPKNTDAILKLAELYLFVKNYEESLNLIESAININPYIAREYFMKGLVFVEKQDSAKAISSFQTAVEQDPDYFDAYIQLGLIFSHKGKAIALTYFNNASNIEPNNPEPYYDKGMFYQFGEDYNDAITSYLQLLQMDSLYKNAWYNLGVIYYINKVNYDSAFTCFNKAISIDTTYYLAYFGRGNCYEQKKNKEKALSDFSHAYRINPTFKDAKVSYDELKNMK